MTGRQRGSRQQNPPANSAPKHLQLSSRRRAPLWSCMARDGSAEGGAVGLGGVWPYGSGVSALAEGAFGL